MEPLQYKVRLKRLQTWRPSCTKTPVCAYEVRGACDLIAIFVCRLATLSETACKLCSFTLWRLSCDTRNIHTSAGPFFLLHYKDNSDAIVVCSVLKVFLDASKSPHHDPCLIPVRKLQMCSFSPFPASFSQDKNKVLISFDLISAFPSRFRELASMPRGALRQAVTEHLSIEAN